MKSLQLALGLLVVAGGFSFAGCSDDSSGANNNGQGGADEGAIACDVIGELCHEADTGSGPAHDCHEVGHVGETGACLEQFDSCIHTCVQPETGEAGASSSEADPHCSAIGELCHEVDDGNGPLHACHEVGHIGEPTACAAKFDSCATICLAARAKLEAGSSDAGGAGGAAGATGAGGTGAAGKGAGGAGGTATAELGGSGSGGAGAGGVGGASNTSGGVGSSGAGGAP